ncbi:hypothetical protein GOBAR_DD32929 [Gossypium barbadense]|nr:hypothetical protein GOBAR_DD32929 [Gossypium barbadense]
MGHWGPYNACGEGVTGGAASLAGMTPSAQLCCLIYDSGMEHKQSDYQRSIGDNKVIEVGILSMPSFIGPLQQDDDDNMGMLLCLWTQPVY